MTDEKEVALSLPGEWALKKAFGPVLGELGEDMKKLYATGRDRIIAFGYNKISNVDDGKSANLRVTRDVFWNGSFTDEAICAEYFGGILASSWWSLPYSTKQGRRHVRVRKNRNASHWPNDLGYSRILRS